MIIDNVKERLSVCKSEIDFIKECLWQGKSWKGYRGA